MPPVLLGSSLLRAETSGELFLNVDRHFQRQMILHSRLIWHRAFVTQQVLVEANESRDDEAQHPV